MPMAKTDEGLKMLKDRRSGLSPRQRTALILVDGQRTLDEVLAATSAAGVTRDDLARLEELGLIAEQPAAPQPIRTQPAPAEFLDSSSIGWGRYVRAYGIATELSSELSRKDTELSLAIDAAGSIEELEALAPRIRAAVSPLKFARFEAALKAR
jgi:hypothetical protein